MFNKISPSVLCNFKNKKLILPIWKISLRFHIKHFPRIQKNAETGIFFALHKINSHFGILFTNSTFSAPFRKNRFLCHSSATALSLSIASFLCSAYNSDSVITKNATSFCSITTLFPTNFVFSAHLPHRKKFSRKRKQST